MSYGTGASPKTGEMHALSGASIVLQDVRIGWKSTRFCGGGERGEGGGRCIILNVASCLIYVLEIPVQAYCCLRIVMSAMIYRIVVL